MAMIRTQVYIPEELYLQAKNLARIENKNISMILRDGLRKGVTSSKKTKKIKSDPFGDFQPVRTGVHGVDAARNHDDIYDI